MARRLVQDLVAKSRTLFSAARSPWRCLSSAAAGPMATSAEAPRVEHERFFSQRMLSTPKNPFVNLLPLMQDRSVKSLCQGAPPEEVFPLRSLRATLKDGTEVDLSPQEVELSQRYAPMAKDGMEGWIREHVAELHSPPCADWAVAVAAGSMASVDHVCAMLLDRGDTILVEEFSFMAALDAFHAYGARLVPVRLDQHGLQPEALEAACVALAEEGRSAKFLYTVPVGQNPTGSVLKEARYERIYELARRHDFLIVEDDAYFYQQHRPRESTGLPSEELPGLRLGRTFLSLDVEGRVLRLDSFSKVIAPGFRLGWVTGPKALVQRYNLLAYSSSQNGCSLSMVLLARLLRSWGREGLEEHLKGLQGLLRDRCRALLAAAELHLRAAGATWHPPEAGMFLWVSREALAAVPDDQQLLEIMRSAGVAVLPGSFCLASRAAAVEPTQPCPFLRLTFVLEEGHYPEAMSRLSAALQAFNGT